MLKNQTSFFLSTYHETVDSTLSRIVSLNLVHYHFKYFVRFTIGLGFFESAYTIQQNESTLSVLPLASPLLKPFHDTISCLRFKQLEVKLGCRRSEVRKYSSVDQEDTLTYCGSRRQMTMFLNRSKAPQHSSIRVCLWHECILSLNIYFSNHLSYLTHRFDSSQRQMTRRRPESVC